MLLLLLLLISGVVVIFNLDIGLLIPGDGLADCDESLNLILVEFPDYLYYIVYIYLTHIHTHHLTSSTNF